MALNNHRELIPGTREIVAIALKLPEEKSKGPSMRRLAERIGIRAPSVYKHLPRQAGH